MKALKHIVFIVACIVFSQTNAQRKLSDEERITITPHVSDQVEFVSPIVKNNLSSKLNQIVARNGYGGSLGFENRFIITPNISVLTKDIIQGSPTRIAITLDVALFVGDGFDGIKYASTNLTLKGVGTNETKAYLSAIKRIRPTNKKIRTLLAEARESIVDYYADNCDFIIGDIEKLEDTNDYYAALKMAMSVPTVSKKCYEKASKKVKPIYKKLIDNDCEMLMLEAKSAWNLGHNIEAASNASKYLNDIDPASSCYPDVKDFVKTISDKIKEDSGKTWDFTLKKDKDFTEYSLKELDAYKEVNLEKAKNQPKEVYKIGDWW